MRLDCNIYFIFYKQAFNGLLKVIGIQNILLSPLRGRNSDYLERANKKISKELLIKVKQIRLRAENLQG